MGNVLNLKYIKYTFYISSPNYNDFLQKIKMNELMDNTKNVNNNCNIIKKNNIILL